MMRRLVLASLLAAPAWASDPFGRGSWSSLQAGLAGRPAIVHFWSLTCAPCMAELPLWPDLAWRLPDVVVVLVNTDPPEQAAAIARAAQRAGLEPLRQYAFADRFAARLRWEVDPDWQGELPRTDLLARDGTRRALLGSIDMPSLAEWAKEQTR
jgi:thiol-disulfide isomerase/thioredoxin